MSTVPRAESAMSAGVDIGPLGVCSFELRRSADPAIAEAAAELHSQGWGALWIPGAGGDGLWRDADRLLDLGSTASVVLGVMSIWSPDARIATREHARLTSKHGARIMAGLGVSDARAAAAAGAMHTSPIASMRAYLSTLDSAEPPLLPEHRLLAALGPKMATLAGERTAGMHPFLVTPEANATYREILGDAALLAPHQAVVLDTDADRARNTAREAIGMFLGFPSYQANLRRLGFDDDDLVPGGSDRLIDALIARGDVDDVARRIEDHIAAGADHVALHVLTNDGDSPMAVWRELAPLNTTDRTQPRDEDRP